nr:MAG TPA: hypothetical protein [Crassvirales sp.]
MLTEFSNNSGLFLNFSTLTRAPFLPASGFTFNKPLE